MPYPPDAGWMTHFWPTPIMTILTKVRLNSWTGSVTSWNIHLLIRW